MRSPDDARIVCVLGPTNTGKTHRAVERMLEHPSGLIGLPLRLLAREVYDRISVRCGEARVALVTGEEKRVPPNPRYWVSTVEAMPRDLAVDFLAIDEIQLAAHPERGHVFTDRMLNARGRVETWFLGSDSMRPVLASELPEAEFTRSPRLSTLTEADVRRGGPSTVGALHRRSAIVAFSLSRVFELGDRLRRRRGGAAIVVGALSPRARNAQVAMYQAGEVDFLVATDAIGMGLNLGIDHVAFADTQKFDGRVERPLSTAELAQIAGRAGRYTQNGTFGTLAPLPPLARAVAREIEEHRFPPIETLYWREPRPAMSSVDELLASLRNKPPAARYRRIDDATDVAMLRHLAAKKEIRDRARSSTDVELLWSVCSIPDYRQLLAEDHASLLGRVFGVLVERGSVAKTWIGAEIERIARPTRELDTLMDRIAEIRLWNYIANQPGWVDGAKAHSERAREVEDALSDVLHEVLTQRFVATEKRAFAFDRPAQKPIPPAPASSSKNVFAQLLALREQLPSGADRAVTQSPNSPRWIESLLEAKHAELEVDALGNISFGGQRVGRLTRGRDLLEPAAVVSIEVTGGHKLRLTRRLTAFSRDLVTELTTGFADLELSPAGKGVAHCLLKGLGTALVEDVRAQIEALTELDLAALTERGVVLGRTTAYVPLLLKRERMVVRCALVRAWAFAGPSLEEARPDARAGRWPTGTEVSLPLLSGVSPKLHTSLGYPVIGPRAIRADVLERVAELDRAGDPEARRREAGRLLACKARDVEAVLGALPGSDRAA
ncbi:MAG: helicase-related protein [Polyangiaceae bacterium]